MASTSQFSLSTTLQSTGGFYALFFFQLFLFNFPPPRTMPGDALNARSMNCKGENITLLSVSNVHIPYLEFGNLK